LLRADQGWKRVSKKRRAAARSPGGICAAAAQTGRQSWTLPANASLPLSLTGAPSGRAVILWQERRKAGRASSIASPRQPGRS